ncbi:hypothetical protein H632_c12p0 [Helicosporidium sp. ATCC 50920]|nr:hypothetical protein H632_c12p0 [Helicosporidium sp. ATCC 50920]|eukprot:KDD77130.1 hypothetical protein H632_c12p0 [Helicosporidium sp. ATCC 50920]
MLEECARYMVPCMSALLQFHTNEGFCELIFKRYHAHRKALADAVCKEFTEEAGRKTTVGFGSWSTSDPGGIIKGRPAGPVNAVKECLGYYCHVVTIDENRRSQLQHRCHMRMDGQRHEKAKDEDGKK